MSRSPAPAVLIIAALPPPTHGQAFVTERITEAFQLAGIRLDIIDTSPKSLRKSLAYHRARIIAHFCAFTKVFSSSRQRSIVIYTVYESGLGIIYNFIIALASRLRKGKVFIHHHTSAHLHKKSLLTSALLLLLGKASTHVVLSDQMSKRLTALYGVRRIRICNNAAFVPDYEYARAARAKGLRLGLLSNLTPEKGVDDLLKLARSAATAGFQVHLAGPVTDAKLAGRIADACKGNHNSLFYHGPLYGEKKWDFVRSLDLFVFPSRYINEAQSMAVLEAMSAGVPVIGRDQGFTSELIGDAGHVLKSSNMISEIQSIAALYLQEPFELDFASRRARARFEKLRDESHRSLDELAVELSRALRGELGGGK